VQTGGAVLFNSDKLTCDVSLLRENVLAAPLPVGTITQALGKLQPVMQNTVALGAAIFFVGLDFEVITEVLADTFKHKGQAVVDQNVKIARAGYDYAKEHFVPETKPSAWVPLQLAASFIRHTP
jgi:2-oxoglutarate ferredoxin oxidoreductase subunit alpha